MKAEVPQVFHWFGKVSGAGTAPGIAFSPMRFPIIIAMLAGRVVRMLLCMVFFYYFWERGQRGRVVT
jgi:hypothetical protein